jgi:ribosomal protein L7/L12
LINLTTGHNHKIAFPHWSSSLSPEFNFDDGRFWFTSTKNWSISPQGIIEEHTVYAAPKSKTSSEQLLMKIRQHSQTGSGVLKKIKNIYINTGGNLVVNSHLLSFSGSGSSQTLKFHHSGNKTVHKSATLAEENLFQFKNGSTIEVDRVGMLLLRYPDETTPSMYIPTSLGTTLGVATPDEFAGYDYYHRTQRKGLVLYDAGPNKLSVVRYLKEHLSFGLQEAKDLVDQIPSWIDMNAIHRTGISSIGSFVKGLTDLQAKVVVRDSGTIKKIELQEFHSKHLQPYIKNILQDGI